MKNYYRVMLGKQSIHAAIGFAGNFIGADFEIPQDLTTNLPDDWRAFNKKFIPIFLSTHPDKTKIGAYISLVGAAITLFLNWLLIPSMSYYGSAIATIAAYGSMMIISYKLGQKYYPIPYDFNKIFSYLGLTLVFSAVSFYIPSLRENYFVKIILLAVFLYFIYHNEKETLVRIIKRK